MTLLKKEDHYEIGGIENDGKSGSEKGSGGLALFRPDCSVNSPGRDISGGNVSLS